MQDQNSQQQPVMNNEALCAEHWRKFIAEQVCEVDHNVRYECWYFGDSESMAAELGQLVKQGVKTATSSLLWEYEADGEALPEAGEYSIITTWNGDPICIIQTIDVAVMPFNKVAAEFAYAEGEGNRSLDYWRTVHWKFFSRVCKVISRAPSMTMPVVCERFQLVYPLV